MSNLEARVEHLEADMRSLREDVAVIKSNYATNDKVESVKSELHQAMNTQTWKMITAMGIMTAIFAAIVKWPF